MILAPSEFDVHLFHEGTLHRAHKFFGAQLVKSRKDVLTRFTVWAPHAQSVSVVGNFNQWDHTHHPLEKLNNEGLWTLLIDQDLEGEM